MMEVLNECDVFEKTEKSHPKSVVGVPRATDFNTIITLDLKEMGKSDILWMVWTFIKMIKGVLIRDKKAHTIMDGIYR